MSKKALRALLGTLGGLALLYGLVVLTSRRAPGSGDSDTRLAEILDRIDPAAVTAVTIRGPATSMELARSGTGWTVDGYPADSAALARLWRALEETSVGSVVAANPANHGRLGVSEDSAWVVTFRSGAGDADTVLLGRSGTLFGSAYGRAPDDDPVVEIRGDLRGAVARSLVDWRDKTIVRVDTATIGSVSVSRGGEAVLLERDAGAWRVGTEAADSLAVQDLLREVATLRATGFASDTATVPDEDRRTLVVRGVAGDTVAALVFGEAEGQFRVRGGGAPTVFTLPAWRVDRITPGRRDLVPGAPSG